METRRNPSRGARRTLLSKCLALLGAASLALTACLAPTAGVEHLDVCRGLDHRANGRASLAPSQFRFNLDLSTFEDPTQFPQAKNCWFWLTLERQRPGYPWDVVGLPGFWARKTEPPTGHWSIFHPEHMTEAAAQKKVSDYAKAHLDRVDPPGCRPTQADLADDV